MKARPSRWPSIACSMRAWPAVAWSGRQHRVDPAGGAGAGKWAATGAREQVKDGMGQVVLLSGEAGIGKSRLVQVLKDPGGHRAGLADAVPVFAVSTVPCIP